MSSAQVGAVLGYIRKLAGTWKDEELPDNQLLERFAAHRDEAAFAALLRRHGPMVLSVCQSVLHNLHDAEDAFQAAFLVLAKKAGSIHRREAVSGWLYRVAYHLAVRSQADAARRRIHERRAATMPSADPVLDLSLREVRAILFEELENLPEQYRSPLVLCGLEEMSREEAARLLGCSVGAVKGKLERGRELLRARVRRRGLELSAGLFATVLATNFAPAQISASLAASTLKAALWLAVGSEPAAGVISAKVAALVKGATTTMFYSKLKVATALLLTVTAALAGLGALRHQVLAAKQPEMKQSDGQKGKAQENGRPVAVPAKQQAADSVLVSGRVLDAEGKPVAGAKLYLGPKDPRQPAFRVRATTGRDGRFAFTFARSELDVTSEDNRRGQVLAMAKGFGSDWDWVGTTDKSVELTLRLGKDVPINGRIVDQDGQPIAGAKVHVDGASAYPGLDLKEVLEEMRQQHQDKLNRSVKGWSGPLPDRAQVFTTGADGRIRLAGFGSDRIVWFRIEGPTIVTTWMKAMTRPGEPVDISKNDRFYGASFDHVARASRPIRGVVRDKATGKPVAGVEIGSFMGSEKTTADKDGRYELLGLPQSGRYDLRVRPANGQPYFGGGLRIDDTPGLEPLTADVELLSGIPLEGRVVDKATGQPVPGARVDYHALFPNAEIGKLAPYSGPSSEATAGADGSFALVVLPGPGVLGATAPKRESYMSALVTVKELNNFFKNKVGGPQTNEDILNVASGVASIGFIVQQSYHSLVLLDVEEKTQSLKRDIVLEPARTLKGSVVGPDGKPALGITAHGLTLQGSETLKTENFTVKGLNPRRSRQLVFLDKEKRLGAFVVVRGDESRPLEIKLQPCGSVTGRIVDKDGQPVAGLDIVVHNASLSGPQPELHITTGRDGRFRVEGLVPGLNYMVYKPSSARILREIAVESGKNKDLGDVDGHVGENP